MSIPHSEPAHAKISSGAIEVVGRPPSSKITVTSIMSKSPPKYGHSATVGRWSLRLPLIRGGGTMTNNVAELAERTPRRPLRARPGRDDVRGLAVIGQPFASRDVLCLRR